MSVASQTYSWKIGAPAGFGVMTVGMLMAKLAARHGLQAAGYAEYPSLIQGGHNTIEVTTTPINLTETLATKRAVDCLVCLTPETLTLHRARLSETASVVYDPAVFQPTPDQTIARLIPVPLGELQASLKADKIMINTIAFGASAALFGGSRAVALQLIADQFAGKKSSEVAQLNQQCAAAGFTYIVEHFPEVIRSVPTVLALPAGNASAELSPGLAAAAPTSQSEQVTQPSDQLVMTGNDAFSLAAIAADCRLYVSYPMTPTSAVLEILAFFQETTGMVVKSAEDEIAVIGIALGASFAGVRAAVGTSGGGFALMVEHISYAGIAEIPLVILLGQRPGPATGMPTWTEQGDLLFAVHAGHGEFPKIVLAPGDLDEMATLTIKAFDLADRYQTPVIVITDKYLAESQRSVSSAVLASIQSTTPDRGKLSAVGESATYERYADSADGISPRLTPGTPGQYYQANSYEHLPDGHTSEESAVRVQQVAKRARKMATYLQNDWAAPAIYGALDTAQLVLVTWGSQKIPCRAAQTLLTEQGIKTALIHFTHLYPLDRRQLTELFAKISAPLLLVENNSTGQLSKLLMEEVGIEIADMLLKYDGRPHFQEGIVTAVLERMKKL